MSVNNRFLLFFAVPIVFILWAAKTAGLMGVLVYILESFVGVILLEIVNYARHYGLLRKEISPGEYE